MPEIDWQLMDQVAVVTGGSRGIGRAISLSLARAGARVIVNFQRAQEAANSLAQIISEFGGSCALKAFDVADPDQVQQSFKEIMEEHGRIDILVNNAGITRDQLFVRMKPQDWKEVLEVNLTGAFLCSRSAARSMMRRRAGCIINIASVAGLAGNPGQVNYSASKAGLIGFSKALARELAPWRIRVNAVSPGYIQTDMTEQLPDKVKDEIKGLIPLERFGSPDDVAWAVCFLASPASDYVTGQILNVSGGLYM